MDVFEAMWTTRAMRRLDASRPVPLEDLLLVLEAAGKAPSGGNGQVLRWVVVTDSSVRQDIGQMYRAMARPVLLRNYAEQAATDPAVDRMLSSALHLADHLGQAPVLLVPCAPTGRVRVEASVYPAVQNLMLAARALGLGSTLTQLHREDEGQLKAILGIPAGIETFAIIPLGYPTGRWGEAKRKPAAEVTFWDRWGVLREEVTRSR